MVRDPSWQAAFLSKPLAERKCLIAEMREGSRMAQREKSQEIMDANQSAVVELLESTAADAMIHGHTHRPARHDLLLHGKNFSRYVLSDWDCEESPGRGGWIAISPDGEIHRYGLDGARLD
jgi:UDP-2,3-diacylglucosamine hydrolase